MSHTFHVQTDDIELIERLKSAFASHSRPRVTIEPRLDADPTTESITRITKQRDDANAAHTAALTEIRDLQIARDNHQARADSLQRQLNDEYRRSARLVEEAESLERELRDPEPTELETLRRERDEARSLRVASEDGVRVMRKVLEANTARCNELMKLFIAVGEWRGELTDRNPQNDKLAAAYIACNCNVTTINCAPTNDDDLPF